MSSKSTAKVAASPVVTLGDLSGKRFKVGDDGFARERTQSLLERNLEMEATTMEAQEKASVVSGMSVTMPAFDNIPDEIPDPNVLLDWLKYVLENNISAYPFLPFTILAALTAGGMLVFAIFWQVGASRVEIDEGDEEIFGTTWKDALFLHIQLITSAGYEDIPDENGLRYIFFCSIFFGLVIFAILVGFITDVVGGFMKDLDTGRTKVAEDGHSLILGWNEATQRVVVQIAFLRRQYQMLNEEKYFGILWFLPFLMPVFRLFGLLEKPSTTLADSDIVLMTNNKTKEEMHILLEGTLSERGINPRRTALGLNIICRIGDPTLSTDLMRVAADKAAAIIVMMTEEDQDEEDASEGKIKNGATLRVCLALRHVLFTNSYSDKADFHPDLRIVLQMTSPSHYVDSTNFQNADGTNVIIPMDLSKFLNSLMFLCAAQPGLSKVLLGILDFEGVCIRRRMAQDLRGGPRGELGGCISHTFGSIRQQYTKAIFIGIIRPSMPRDQVKSNGFGLLPRPDVVVQNDDLLIFIGPKSSPEHDYGMLAKFDEYIKQAKETIKALPNIAITREKHLTGNDHVDTTSPRITKTHSVKKRENMIVAGWRPLWLTDPSRFQDRLVEVADVRLPGSEITFINFVEPDDFESMMTSKDIGATRQADQISPITKHAFRMYEMPAPHQGILIKHHYGDAAEPEVIDEIMSSQTIHTAIVLGTQANAKLSSRSRDTRVLNIMLLLRKFWAIKGDDIPIHVVGENQKDETANLALGPRKANSVDQERKEKKSGFFLGTGQHDRQPDFINTQAVFARALTQAAAYPRISRAVTELLNSGPDFVDVVIVAASDYVPLGKPMVYGVVRAMVLCATGERSICLGIMPMNGNPIVNPEHDKNLRPFNEDDRLIILRRMLLPGEQAGL